MGVITISMDGQSEKMLRNMARAKYGGKKDALSKTIVNALMMQENKLEQATERLKKRMFETTPVQSKKK
jgi:hypothetical protein